MIQTQDATATRPYLIRALYEWCTDNGFTPHIAVNVDDSVRVPQEHVKNGEIVLNIGLDATNSLQLGNDYIEFKARFSGVAREILIPVSQVTAIFARENGQGMAFPLEPKRSSQSVVSVQGLSPSMHVADDANKFNARKGMQLVSVESNLKAIDPDDEPTPPPIQTSAKNSLKLVK